MLNVVCCMLYGCMVVWLYGCMVVCCMLYVVWLYVVCCMFQQGFGDQFFPETVPANKSVSMCSSEL